MGGKVSAAPFLFLMQSTKLVTEAILGTDIIVVRVNKKNYFIKPPTIKTIAGVGRCLCDLGDAKTIQDILKYFADIECAAKALSWLVKGDESIWEELSHGTLEEVTEALEKGISMISMENFLKLLVSAKNVQMLIAKPR